jgi:hypothetical protein
LLNLTHVFENNAKVMPFVKLTNVDFYCKNKTINARKKMVIIAGYFSMKENILFNNFLFKKTI